jgi:hypothetical protein
MDLRIFVQEVNSHHFPIFVSKKMRNFLHHNSNKKTQISHKYIISCGARFGMDVKFGTFSQATGKSFNRNNGFLMFNMKNVGSETLKNVI